MKRFAFAFFAKLLKLQTILELLLVFERLIIDALALRTLKLDEIILHIR